MKVKSLALLLHDFINSSLIAVARNSTKIVGVVILPSFYVSVDKSQVSALTLLLHTTVQFYCYFGVYIPVCQSLSLDVSYHEVAISIIIYIFFPREPKTANVLCILLKK